MQDKSNARSQSTDVRGVISNWNLDRLKAYLIKKGYADQYVEKGVGEYRRFLEICARNPNREHAVSQPIDEIWHNHILFTKNYRGLCDALGMQIHHNPFVDDSDWDGHSSRYENVLGSYRELFEEDPSLEFWPKTGAVGPCDCSNSDCNGYAAVENA